MGNKFLTGVYPVMLTPFTAENQVDYENLEKLVEWYIDAGVAGLFAVCQSSEMFFLTLEERVNITKFVVEKVAGRVAVVASGHISDSLEEQAEELNAVAQAGPDAVILLTNRLAREEEDDGVWIRNLELLLEKLPADLPLGFYECPYPYKRVMTPEQLRWCGNTGRFYFTKDTSCDLGQIKKKLEATRGSNIRLYNANTSTLLESLQEGASGFSGVMANFHPGLYVWLTENFRKEPEKARQVADLLTVASLIERQVYPVNAKFYQRQIGNFKTIHTRSKDSSLFNATCELEMDQLTRLVEFVGKAVLEG
ncbi:MAG TPA: dihydrodipicolinate synthase family protein [Clostridiales bacterium]|nr:dihydrodipicolinate synthase family protein [Clostridiales bacterium]